MAYPKRVYTDGVEEVSYVDMNRIETGIETNDLAIAKINADNIARDKEISTKETITGAQEKANVTLKSAKEYADGKVKLNGSTTNVNFNSKGDAVKSIETTDSKGTKTSLSLSSNSTHVEMPNGKTLRDFAYQTLDWETKTSAGSDIAVTNGKEAWVRNAKISGNTVNNIATTGEYTLQADGKTWITKPTAVNKDFIQQGVKYYIHAFVYENTFINSLIVHNKESGVFTPTCEVGAGKTGYFKFEVTPKETINSYTILSQVKLASETGKVRYAICVTKENVDLNSVIPTGLSSVKAILTNNGLKYPFYATEEDKANGKVIDLGGIEGARNTLEILKDGSGIYVRNSYKKDILTTQTFILDKSDDVNTIRFRTSVDSNLSAVNYNAICNNFPTRIGSSHTDTEYIYLYNNILYVNVLKSKLTSQDVEGFKAWLQANPLKVCYQLAAPIVAHIPKELIPPIITEQTNNFSTDSAVKPIELSVTIAVDKVSDLETRLAQVEAIMSSKSNTSLAYNYVEDEYEQNKLLEARGI